MSFLMKCHICKLDKGSCNQKCIDIDDVSELYIDGATENDVIPDRFCTAHKCPHNYNGFRCKDDRCHFGRVIEMKNKTSI